MTRYHEYLIRASLLAASRGNFEMATAMLKNAANILELRLPDGEELGWHGASQTYVLLLNAFTKEIKNKRVQLQ